MRPHFFDAEDLGESLKEVENTHIKKNEAGITHRWFHSSKDADFFVWLDDRKNVIKQQITFYGQVVEWNIIEGVKTGLIVEDESRPKAKSADLIRFDGEAQKTPIQQAVQLLQNMTALNDLERHSLAKNFTHGSTSKDLDPEEFVRRYGSSLKAQETTGKLRRLFGWIRRQIRRQS